MTPTNYQKPEIRDNNDNIISAGAFGKNTALSNATNDGWIDYVANDLEALNNGKADKSAYLPLSGGTMKGDIHHDGSNGGSPYLTIQEENTTGAVVVRVKAWDAGASLVVYGKNWSDASNIGAFVLRADDGTNNKALFGKPNGGLSWGGQNVLTASNYNSYALPLSGGTMSGTIVSTIEGIIKCSSDNGTIAIYGSSTWNHGSYLLLTGKDNNSGGSFTIASHNGSQSCTLSGNPTGTLTWGGSNILTAANYNSYALPLSGGTMSGDIYHSGGGGVGTSYFTIQEQKTTGALVMRIASWTGGASLSLYGKDWDNTGNIGTFILRAHNGSSQKDLFGKPDGTLTWAGQPIQTSSDKRLKQDFADVPADVLETWGKINWQQFKYIDDVKRKGDSCRFHTGLVAQDVKEVGEENNVDLLKYGILCHDVREAVEEEKDEDGNIIKEASEAVDLWTIRYEEALAMEAAYQRRRADRLEERIARLEALLTNTETETE